jgi:hypothetical protein
VTKMVLRYEKRIIQKKSHAGMALLLVVLSIAGMLLSAPPGWEPITGNYDNFAIYLDVYLYGELFTEGESNENILAAFGPGGDADCRAIAIRDTVGPSGELEAISCWYATVRSGVYYPPLETEYITFKIYDAEADTVYTCEPEEPLAYSGSTVGDIYNRFCLSAPEGFVIPTRDEITGEEATAYVDNSMIEEIQWGDAHESSIIKIGLPEVNDNKYLSLKTSLYTMLTTIGEGIYDIEVEKSTNTLLPIARDLVQHEFGIIDSLHIVHSYIILESFEPRNHIMELYEISSDYSTVSRIDSLLCMQNNNQAAWSGKATLVLDRNTIITTTHYHKAHLLLVDVDDLYAMTAIDTLEVHNNFYARFPRLYKIADDLFMFMYHNRDESGANEYKTIRVSEDRKLVLEDSLRYSYSNMFYTEMCVTDDGLCVVSWNGYYGIKKIATISISEDYKMTVHNEYALPSSYFTNVNEKIKRLTYVGNNEIVYFTFTSIGKITVRGYELDIEEPERYMAENLSENYVTLSHYLGDKKFLVYNKDSKPRVIKFGKVEKAVIR